MTAQRDALAPWQRARLAAEVLGVYVLAPWLVRRFQLPLIPVLLVVGLCVFWLLRRDGTFVSNSLWAGTQPTQRRLAYQRMFWQVPFVGSLFFASVWLWQRDQLFVLPRTRPLLWLFVVFFYPLSSVYPQELLFRAFFLHRYGRLLKNPYVLRAVSSLLFGWAHILYGNYISVALSTLAGWVFWGTFERTGSLRTVAVEHSLYGIAIFTVGLGEYFFRG